MYSAPEQNLQQVVEGSALRTALGDQPIGDRLRHLLSNADAPRDLILGARPEAFEDAALVDDAKRPDGAEELAADAGATDLGAAGGLVTRLSVESRIREGTSGRVWLDPAKIHLFDPETGQTLTAGERPSARIPG